MVSGGMSCIKYLMFVFNFIFVVCGITLIAIGAVVARQDFTNFLDSKYVTAPTILIVVGCVIFVLAFLGCCGAVRENYCMVMTFGVLLFLVFVIEIAGGITAYVYRGELESILKKNMNESIAQHKPDALKIWDEMQMKLECCGVDDYTSWGEAGIPVTCCEKKPERKTCSKEEVFKRGCYGVLLGKLKDAIGMVGGVAIGIGVVELIGIMFSWCLASAIKKEYEGV